MYLLGFIFYSTLERFWAFACRLWSPYQDNTFKQKESYFLHLVPENRCFIVNFASWFGMTDFYFDMKIKGRSFIQIKQISIKKSNNLTNKVYMYITVYTNNNKKDRRPRITKRKTVQRKKYTDLFKQIK